MKTLRQIKYIIAALFTFVVTLISGQGNLSAYSAIAKAETFTYSNVLDDLQKDENFNAEEFPSVANDYSVYLITIAESDKNDLFAYVYQPSNDTINLECTQISISLGYSVNGENLSPTLYDLELVSTSGVFDKYLVKNLEYPNEETRYYNIVALYRELHSLVDDTIEGGTTNAKAYSVGEQWCTYMQDGVITYEMVTFKTLEITPTLNGNVYYSSGFSFNDILGISDSCNSHFLAFNVDGIEVDGVAYDINVRHIYDADVTYKSRQTKVTTVSNSMGIGGSTTITYPNGEQFNSDTVTLTDDQTHTYQGEGLFAKAYTWKRIMTSSEFIKNYEEQGGTLNETSKEKIEESQYVFCFAETEYSTYTNSSTSDGIPPITYTTTSNTYTQVSEVTVLRLHFMDTSGTVYNLGVVSDITSPDDIPDGTAQPDWLKEIEKWFSTVGGWVKTLFTLVGGAILIALLWPVLYPALVGLIKLVVKIVTFLIKWLCKGIWAVIKFIFKVITAPVRFVVWLITGK